MIYNTLAAYYDMLVGDPAAVDAWVEWIESFQPGPAFLELACGSGEITRRLADHHQVSALDLSEAMVAEAARKDPEQKIQFAVQDMRDLSGYGQFDAIGCFCDSFNYLLDEETVADFFAQTAAHLKPGGLFLFDSHSLDRLEEFAQEYEEAGCFEDGTGLQWIIAAQDDFLFQDFAFYFPDQTIQEHHMQRIYDPERIVELLEPWYDIVGIRTDFEQEGIQPGEKYFFACRRKEEVQ